jgi:penicillin G amidase
MKSLRSISLKLLVVFVLMGGALFSYVFWKTDSWQQNKLTLAAPGGPVSVNIDRNGIAHIESPSSDYDAFYALGYLHAKDRLWQIELQRHLVKGNLSEMFGEVTLDQDKYVRTWGFYRAAKNHWKHYDERTKSVIEHYTKGVNDYLKNDKEPLQTLILRHDIEPWELVDSYAWSKMIAWQLQNSWQDKINNYYLRKQYGENKIQTITPQYPLDAPTTIGDGHQGTTFPKIHSEFDLPNTVDALLPKSFAAAMVKTQHFNRSFNFQDFPGKGSNNWVLSGKHTRSGLPLLANDLHLLLSAPNSWYMVSLKSPNLQLVGATMPGMPMFFSGHNQHIAWSITDAAIDSQDVYLASNDETIKYLHETIKVKGQDDVDFIVETIDNGPVINGILDAESTISDAGKIVVKWTALNDDDKTVQSFININYSKNWDDFKIALMDYVAPPQNFLYADVHGNIGYYLPGKIPVRTHWSGRYPVPMDENHQWKKYIAFENMPHLLNPDSGIIATANNKAVAENYEHRLTYQWRGMPYRIQRINDLLDHNGEYSVSDMAVIQTDVHSRLWQEISPFLLSASTQQESSRRALNNLKRWDGRADINSTGATIFAFWFKELMTIQPRPPGSAYVLENPLFLIDQIQRDGEFCVTKNYKNCADLISGTLDIAVNKLNDQLGRDQTQWVWGAVHKTVLDDFIFKSVPVLNRIWKRSVASPGSSYTVNTGTYDSDYLQIAGPTYRQVIDLSCFNNSRYMMPLGQSGNPLSRHYDDLLDLWGRGEYIKINSGGCAMPSR